MFKNFVDKAVVSLCFWAVLGIGGAPSAEAAESKRVALIVGNSAYTKIGDLKNPRNDAKAFAAVLGRVEPKFKVLTGYDLSAAEFERRIGEFEKELQGADVALFYFAGHSVQIGSVASSGGENYLLGVDAAPEGLQEKDLANGKAEVALRAARLGAVMSRMEQFARTRLVFLDACRDNPLVQASAAVAQSAPAAAAGTQMAAASAAPAAPGGNAQVTRSAGRGLAPVMGRGGKGGAYIAFATSPGEVALDGDGANSPFTAALARHIATRGTDIDQTMTRVRRDVMKETARTNAGRPQEPWSHSSLLETFYFWPQTARLETAPAAKTPGNGAAAPARRQEPERAPAPRQERRQQPDWGSPSPSLGGGVGAGGF